MTSTRTLPPAAPPVRAGALSGPRPTSRKRPSGRRRTPRLRVRGRGRPPLGRPPRRLRAGLALILVLLVAIGGRLVQLQGLDGAAYAAAAEKQRLRSMTLPALRGEVLDRSGAPLARTVEMRTVVVDPTLVEDKARGAKVLAPLLNRPVEEVQADLSRPKTRYVVLARQLDPGVAAQVEQAAREAKVGGVSLETDFERRYPGGDLGANIVGFTGADQRGQAGVELAFDGLLAGKNGHRAVEVDKGGRQIPQGADVESAPIAGSSVRLTLDRDIQFEAQRVLAAQVAATGSEGGSVVVMNPRSGDVLAMATAPTLDANDPGAAPAAARGNSALSDVYEPGSVNKVITAAAALQTGTVTPMTPVFVGRSIRVGGKDFTDSHYTGDKTMTFTGVLAESSNVGTITVAQRLGRQPLYDYLRAFGFGAKTGVGLPGESAGLVPPPDAWSGTSDGTIPIGQGISVTALQVASVYATVANGGVRVPPRVVDAIVSPNGTVSPEPAQPATRVVDPVVARQLSLMLEQVTSDEGTAPAARITGYRIAGKTGTARRVDPQTGRYRPGYYSASFAGFAPADDPQLVVSVVLHGPQTSIFGGQVAAPVFHDVTAFALQRLAIPPTGATTPPATLTLP